MLDISCESSAAILLGALMVNVYANSQACLKPKALRTAKTLLLHYPPISPKLSIRSIKRKKVTLQVAYTAKNIRRFYSKITIIGNQPLVYLPLFLRAPVNIFKKHQAQSVAKDSNCLVIMSFNTIKVFSISFRKHSPTIL